MHVGFDPLLNRTREFLFFVEKRIVQPKINLDMAVLLTGGVLELGSKGSERYRLRALFPFGIELAFLDGNPQVPEHLKFIGVIFMEKFAGQGQGAIRLDARIERLLEKKRLVPRDAVYTQIPDSRPLRGIRKQPQHGKKSRHHLQFAKAGEPDAEI